MSDPPIDTTNRSSVYPSLGCSSAQSPVRIQRYPVSRLLLNPPARLQTSIRLKALGWILGATGKYFDDSQDTVFRPHTRIDTQDGPNDSTSNSRFGQNDTFGQ